MTDSIFSAFTDPTADALLGLTQGFGAAAMPQRMPTPLGAVLGMGAGGAMQGVQAGQALRHAGIQNQQAQIGLDWYRNMMNGGGGGGAPFGAPAPGAAGETDSNGNYIASPRMLASMAMAQIGQGKDPAGVLKLIEAYGTSGRAITPQGNIFSIPGGSAAIASEAAAKATGTKGGEAPYVPPAPFKVPVTDAAGNPVLDKDGQPTFRDQLMTPQQANKWVTGQSSGAAPGGVAPTAPNVAAGLTHILGSPEAAATVMQAKPNAPLEMLPGIAPLVQANPALKGHTAGSLIQQVGSATAPAIVNVPGRGNQIAPRFDSTTGQPLEYSATPPPMPAGARPVSPGNPVGGVGPGHYAPSYVPGSLSAAPVQIPPPGVGGPPVLTPQQTANLEIDKARQMPAKLGPGETQILNPVEAAKGSPPGTGAGADTKVAVSGVQGGAIEAPYGPRGEIEPRQKILTELEETSNGAQKELVQAQLLKQKMHELGSTGPATPFLANLSRYAEQVGVSPETIKKWKLPPGASETEAAALANSLMMEVAKAEFPGRVTNTDLKVAATVKPNPSMPIAAADYLIDNTVIPKAQRDIDRYRHVVPLTIAKLANGEPNPAYDRELRGIYGALNEFDKNRPLSSYSPVLQPPAPPPTAIDHLTKNPALAPQFDAKYGPGASRQYLGRQ